MTDNLNDSTRVEEARSHLATALVALRSAATGFDSANVSNSDLTPEANERVRLTSIDDTRSTLASTLRIAVEQIGSIAAEANERAEKVRPRLDMTDATQLARTAQAWEYNITPMLIAGRTWADILNAAAEDDVLAIERFAPTWIRANRPPFESDAEISALSAGVHDTYARVASDPAVRAAMSAASDANAVLSVAENISASTAGARTSADIAGIEVSARFYAHSVGVNPNEGDN